MKCEIHLVKITFAILCLVVVSGFFPVASNAQEPIGTNLAVVRDWSTELVLNDIFKRTRPWISIEAGRWSKNDIPIALDRHGWVKNLAPGQWVQAYMLSGFKGHLPKNRYRCLYRGSGSIDILNASILASGPGWMDVTFKQSAKFIAVRITKTDPKNYIRDIKIVPIKANGKVVSNTFRSDFLNRWRHFKSIRFMDWMATNHNTQIDWRDRPKVGDSTQGTKNGVALEYMIELANALKIAPWFCMPTRASDAYVRQFARMVARKLDPSLNVYVEYSNEVWNAAFPAHRYAIKMGLKLRLGENKEQAFLHYYTHRSLQMFKIWRDEFGESNRLIRVLSSQAMFPERGRKILDWEDAYKKVDAFAIAPYFEARSLRNFPKGKQVPTMDQVFSLLDEDIEAKKHLFAEYYKMTQSRHLQLITYEGGQHLVARKNPVLNDLFAQINRHPYMYELYKRYLGYWFQSGGGLFMNFSSVIRSSRYGHWGVLEWYDQKITPDSKYSAITDVLSQP